MTAEIVIMNKQAVAVAADSAVTITQRKGTNRGEDQKIFVSANKLFALSKYHPVCIMVYGSASFMGVPWETLIKIYRKELGRRVFGKLSEYADHFLAFFRNSGDLFPESAQLKFFEGNTLGYFMRIRDDIVKKVDKLIAERGSAGDDDVARVVSDAIGEHYSFWDKCEAAAGHLEEKPRDLGLKYTRIIASAKKQVFHKLPISRVLSERIRTIALMLFVKFPKGLAKPGASGVVVTGFGHKEAFPSLQSFSFHGIMNNRLRYRRDDDAQTGHEQTASIWPYAQREMVDTFMCGVDPDYQHAIERGVAKMLRDYPSIILDHIEKLTVNEKDALRKQIAPAGDQMLASYREGLREYRKNNHIEPVVSVVAHLPKDELAAMAESLVRLTSFKRRVTMEAETVAEPIDVAVISKGDGLVWIKRKHYFEPGLNPQFFANYYREDENEQNTE